MVIVYSEIFGKISTLDKRNEKCRRVYTIEAAVVIFFSLASMLSVKRAYIFKFILERYVYIYKCMVCNKKKSLGME